MGNVVSAGVGQNPARQAALGGGLDERVAATTVNKVCGSGLKAVMLASQGIIAGDSDLVVAGGMESMSNCPYLLRKAREGLRLGHGELVDSVIHDGLWCAFENWHMGLTGEAVAERYGVSREEQDAFAAESHQQAPPRRNRGGLFRDEILPGAASRSARAPPSSFDRDEAVRADTTAAALGALKPAFKRRTAR